MSRRIFLAIGFIYLFFSLQIKASVITASTSGLWNVGSTWVGGIAPAPGDGAYIPGGITVTLTSTVDCGSLDVAGTLKFSSTAYMNYSGSSIPLVTGTVNCTATGSTFEYSSGSSSPVVLIMNYYNLALSGGGTKTIDNNSANILVAGNLSVVGTSTLFQTNSNQDQVVTVAGNVVGDGNVRIQAFGGAVFNVGGNYLNTGTLTVDGGSTINYYSLASQQLKMDGVYDGTVNLTGGTKIISGYNNAFNGDLYLNSSTLFFDGGTDAYMTVYGTFYGGGGTLNMSNGGDFLMVLNGPVGSCFTSLTGIGEIDYSYGSGVQTVCGGAYYNLSLLNGTSTYRKILNGTSTVSGSLYLNSAVLSLNGYNLWIDNSAAIANTAFSGNNKIAFSNNGNDRVYFKGNSAARFFNITIPGGFASATDYQPFSIDSLIATVASGSYIGIRPVVTTLSSPYINRMYSVTSSGITAITLFNADFTFAAADVIGSPSALKNEKAGVVNPIPGVVSITNRVFGPRSPNNLLDGNFFVQGTLVSNNYRTTSSGTWSTLSIWESSPDGITWSAAANYPGQLSAGDFVSITGSNVVTTNGVSLLPLGNMTISGTCLLNTGSLTIGGNTLVNSGGTFTIDNSSYLQLKGNIIANGSFGTPVSTTTIEFQNGFTNNVLNVNFYGNILFTTNNQSITGSGALNLQSSSITIVGAIRMTQVIGTLGYGEVSGTSAASVFEMAPGTTLDYYGVLQPMQTGQILATATGTLFEHPSPALIKPTTYYKLRTLSNATILGNTNILTDFDGSSNVYFPSTATSLFVGNAITGAMNLDMTNGNATHVVSIAGFFQPLNLVPGSGKVIFCSTLTSQQVDGFIYHDIEFKGGARKDFSAGAMQVQNKLILSGSVLSVSGSATLDMLPTSTIIGTSAFGNTNMVGLSNSTGLAKDLGAITDLIGFYPIGYGNKYTPVNITAAGSGGLTTNPYVSLLPRKHTPIGTSYVASELYMDASHVTLPHSIDFTFGFPAGDIVSTPNGVFYKGSAFASGAVNLGSQFFSVNASSGSFTFPGAVWAAESSSPLIYRSIANGNWSSTANWESSPDWSTWSPAGNYPGQLLVGEQVLINGPNSITLDVDPLPLGSLTVVGLMSVNNQNVTINGITSINGVAQIADNSFSGKTVFNGLLICDGSLDYGSGNGLAEFHNGVQFNGTSFTAGRSVFSQNNQTFSGTGPFLTFKLTTIAGAIELLMATPVVSFNDNLNGTNANSVFSLGIGTAVSYQFNITAPPMATGILNASAPGSTFSYNLSANCGIKTTNYETLNIGDSGSNRVATFTGNLLAKNFSLNGNIVLSFDGSALSNFSITGTWNNIDATNTIDMSGGGLAHSLVINSAVTVSNPFFFVPGLGNVIYNAPIVQNIFSLTYYNLAIAGSRKDLTDLTTVNNDLTINAGSTLSGQNVTSTNMMQINGKAFVDGELSFGTSLVHSVGLAGLIQGIGRISMKGSLQHNFDIGGDASGFSGIIDADLPSNIIFSSNSLVGLFGAPSKEYPNLVISGTGNKFLLATNSVKGTFYIAPGATLTSGSAIGTTLSIAGDALIQGLLSYSTTNGQTIEVLGNLSIAGANGYIESANGASSSLKLGGQLNTITGAGAASFDNSGFVVEYARNGNQNVLNHSHSNASLLISGSGTKSLIVNCTPYNLSITGGILDSKVYQITGDPAGNMQMNAGTSLLLGVLFDPTAVLFPSNFVTANIKLAPSSNVVYQSFTNQILSSMPTYGNLSTDGSGYIKTMDGNTTVAGDLVVITGHLDFGASAGATQTLEVFGNTTLNGVLQTTNAVTANPYMYFHSNVYVQNAINFNSPLYTQMHVGGDMTLLSGGSLNYVSGSVGHSVTVTGNFACMGTGAIDMTGGSVNHQLFLNGINNFFTDANFVTNAQSRVSYNGVGDQQVAATTKYETLALSGGGNKLMQGNVKVNTSLDLNGAVLDMGPYNFTLGYYASIGGNSNTPTNMIRMSGISTAGIFLKIGGSTNDLVTTPYPLGTSNMLSSIGISNISPTVSGIVQLAIQVLTIPGSSGVLKRAYNVSTTGVGSVSNLDIVFKFDPSDVVGSPNTVVLYNPSKTSLPNGSVNIPSNYFSQTGAFGFPLDGLWTTQSLQPLYVATISGNWSNPAIWATSNDDGATFVPAITFPGALIPANNVSISGGNTVTMDVNIPQIIGDVTVSGTLNGLTGKVITFGGVLFDYGTVIMNGDVYFQNGFVNNGTPFGARFNQGSYFLTNDQTVTGTASSMTSQSITVAGIRVVSFNNSYWTVTNGLIGTDANSIFENRAYLYYNCGGMPMAVGQLISSFSGSLMSYGGTAAQQIRAIPYSGLQLEDSGLKSLVGDVTVGGNLTLDGPLDFGGFPAKTLSVAGLFNAHSTVGMNVGVAHEFILSGIVFADTISGINAGGGSGRVTYKGTSFQYVLGGTYNNLSVTGTGSKILAYHAMVNNLELGGSVLDINSYNLTTLGITGTSPFSASNMIKMIGSVPGGALNYYTNNSSTDFIRTYPIGTNSAYTPMIISSINPGVISPQSLAVQIVLTTGGVNQVNRIFNVSAPGAGILANLDASFKFVPGDLVSAPTQVFYYDPASNLLPNGIVSIPGNVFSTSGIFGHTLNGSFMAISPLVTNLYRSSASGNWSLITNWENWNGTIWQPAINYPGQFGAGDMVSITGLTTITSDINPPFSLSALTITGIVELKNSGFSVTGQTLLQGRLMRITGNGGYVLFGGKLTVANNAGIQDLSLTPDIFEFQNGIDFNGGEWYFNSAITNLYFTTNNQTVSGTAVGPGNKFWSNIFIFGPIEILNTSDLTTYYGTVTGNNALSSLNIGPGREFYYGGFVEPMPIGMLVITAPGSGATYTSGSPTLQQIKGNGQYYESLAITGSTGAGDRVFKGDIVTKDLTIDISAIRFDATIPSSLTILNSFGSSINQNGFDMSPGGIAHKLYFKGPVSDPSVLSTIVSGLTSEVHYQGNNQSVLKGAYNTLVITNTGIKTMLTDISATYLTISGAATLNSDIYQITSSNAGSFFMDANTQLWLGNPSNATSVQFPLNTPFFPSLNIDNSSTVIYRSNSNQTITSNCMGNLSLSGAGQKLMSGGLCIGGDLYIDPGVTFGGVGLIGLSGNIYNDGVYDALTNSNPTTLYLDRGLQTINGSGQTNFNNLSISYNANTTTGDVMLNGDITVAGNLQFTNNSNGIDLNGNKLSLLSGSTITGYNNTRSIKTDGLASGGQVNLSRTSAAAYMDMIIPFGVGADYLPFVITTLAGPLPTSLSFKPISTTIGADYAGYGIRVNGVFNSPNTFGFSLSVPGTSWVGTPNIVISNGAPILNSTIVPSASFDAVQTNVSLPATYFAINIPLVTITGLSLSGSNLCAGASYLVTMAGWNLFNAGNNFAIEISQSNGSFPGNTILGWTSIDPNTVVGITLPSGLVSSNNYVIRALASNPSLVGGSSVNITVGGISSITNISPLVGFWGDDVTLSGTNFTPLTTIVSNEIGGYTYTGSDFTYVSLSTAIITLVTGATGGTLTAIQGCNSATSMQVLTVWPVHATSITITGLGTSVITTSGGTIPFTASADPAPFATNQVTWSLIPAFGVASIDGTGVLQAINDGIVTVVGSSVSDPSVFGIYVVTIVGQTPQKIFVSTSIPTHLCHDQLLNVPFTRQGSYLPGIFIAEIFNGSTTVGIGFATGNPTSINTTIPSWLNGTDFRLKVRHSLATGAFSQDNGSDITVGPIPVITTLPTQNICSGATTNINLVSTPQGVFTWTLSSASFGITGVGAGVGTNISQTIGGSGTVVYSLVSNNGCVSPAVNLTIDVHDIPTVNNPGIQGICSGNLFALTVTSPVAGTAFNWNVASITGSVAGSGGISNNSAISQTLFGQGFVNYMIVPSANGCTGTGYNLEVRVSGTPDISLPVSLLTGNSSLCAGEDAYVKVQNSQIGISYNTYIDITPVSAAAVEGTGGDIILTIPSADFIAGPSTIKVFAVSPGCGNQFLSNQLNVTQGPLADTSYTVSVVNPFVCQGEDRQITLGGSQNGILYAPFVGSVQVGPTIAGTGSIMDIGITGSELLPDTNVVTIQVLSPGCTGFIPFSHNTTLTVQALPTVNPVFSGHSCSGVPMNIVLISTPAGASFSWSIASKTGPVIVNSASSGTGSLVGISLDSVGTVDYLIVPSIGVCAGTPKRLTVTVSGIPVNNIVVKADSVCGGATAGVQLSTSKSGVIYELLSGNNLITSLTGTGGELFLTVPGSSLPNQGSNVFTLLGLGCQTQVFSPDPNIVVLSAPESPQVTTTTISGAECDKLNRILLVPGGHSRYQWRINNIKIAGADSNLYIPVTNGEYSAEVYTGNNCFVLSEVNVVEFSLGKVIPKITALGGSKDTLLRSTESAGYQWYIGVRAIVGADKQDYRPYFSAAYRVRSNPQGKCSAYSDDYYLNNTDYEPLTRYEFEMTDSTIVIDPLRVKSKQGVLSVSPNPASNQFSISYKARSRNSTMKITIYNSLGTTVYTGTKESNEIGLMTTEMERNNLASGIYMVVITDGDERTAGSLVLE